MTWSSLEFLGGGSQLPIRRCLPNPSGTGDTPILVGGINSRSSAWFCTIDSVGATLALLRDVPFVERDPIVAEVIGAAIEVHRALGPGMLESAYERCLAHELMGRGCVVRCEVPLPLIYKGQFLDCGYRLDMLVAEQVIVEIKAVERLLPLHTAQMLTYLRLSGKQRGLLLNFNAVTLKSGLRSFKRRAIDGHQGSAPEV